MKVWVFVEGESDRLALSALWQPWLERLKSSGHGIHFIPLETKQKFFKKIGPRAASKIAGDGLDVAVGLPDLYPNQPFANGPYRHDDLKRLQEVQRELVKDSLIQSYGLSRPDAVRCAMERFHASALCHDLEMLLLAARDFLKDYLRTQDQLGHWSHPVESQNQDRPPKRIYTAPHLT